MITRLQYTEECIFQNDVIIQEVRVPILLPIITKDVGNSSRNEQENTEEIPMIDHLPDEVLTNENNNGDSS